MGQEKENDLNSIDDGIGGCCVKKFLMVARPSFVCCYIFVFCCNGISKDWVLVVPVDVSVGF